MLSSIASKSCLCVSRSSVLNASRGLLRPPSNLPYRGVYRTDGERAMQDDLLVCQKNMNYMPGRNVYFLRDRNQILLKAACEGTVMITTEKVAVDDSQLPATEALEFQALPEKYKLTFNVVPREMSQSFRQV
uniref:Mitochondrial ribosomal protein L27 n=1 Tax=Steinernema glaseri TaxID=37863 RepID=A0A1I7Z3U3_9BILA